MFVNTQSLEQETKRTHCKLGVIRTEVALMLLQLQTDGEGFKFLLYLKLSLSNLKQKGLNPCKQRPTPRWCLGEKLLLLLLQQFYSHYKVIPLIFYQVKDFNRKSWIYWISARSDNKIKVWIQLCSCAASQFSPAARPSTRWIFGS